MLTLAICLYLCGMMDAFVTCTLLKVGKFDWMEYTFVLFWPVFTIACVIKLIPRKL